jgi:putative redox protein
MARLSLDWQGDLAFGNSPGSPSIELHSSTPGVTSPTQALAYAVMACMGMDVVHVLQKARHDLQALRITFESERAHDHPRRYTAMTVHFHVTGPVPPHAVERAIELSRTKYCSVWNSIRQDIRLTTTYEIRQGEAENGK